MKNSSVQTMPTLFIGHGSPMNALANNAYTQRLQKLGQELPEPRAILCISAHWLTDGTQVTSSYHPRTIHDFSGFPPELSQIQYKAMGLPELAFQIAVQVKGCHIALDGGAWGYDHGTWSILKHIYPEAHIPVIQLSLDINKTEQQHFELAQELKTLREQGVLIIGSGNVVHNLRQLSWGPNAEPKSWAHDFNNWYKDKLQTKDWTSITNQFYQAAGGRESIPTLEHYWPCLYTLGASETNDQIEIVFDEIQNSSISMLSFKLG